MDAVHNGLTLEQIGKSIAAGIQAVMTRCNLTQEEAARRVAYKCPSVYPIFDKACTQAEDNFRTQNGTN